MADDLYDLAPEGCIYVCGACGKTSRNRAGFLPDGGRGKDEDEHGRIAQSSWDESCMLNAVLCRPAKVGELGPKWMAVNPAGLVEHNPKVTL